MCCLTDVFKRSLSIVQRMATQGVGLVAVTTGAVGRETPGLQKRASIYTSGLLLSFIFIKRGSDHSLI